MRSVQLFLIGTLAMGLAPMVSAQLPPDASHVVDRLLSGDDVTAETRALLILKDGTVVEEVFAPDYDATDRHVSWSMAKSITSAAVARLVELGLIDSIDDPMPSPFPDGDPRAALSWHDYLTMTDGLDYTEISEVELPLAEQDVVQMMYGPGRFDVIAWIVDNVPAQHPAGERWNYSTAGYHLLGRAVQEVIGAPGDAEATAAWLQREIFAPIGMRDAVPEFDAAGTFLGGSLIYATARDYAAFGELYRRDGRLPDGTRFLPEGWVDYARTGERGDDHNIYGAGFWRATANPTAERSVMSGPYDAFHAGGHEGQTIWIVPSRGLTIVRLGLMPNSPDSWSGLFEANQEIARSFPVASGTSLP